MASYLPERAIFLATNGISNAPGTQAHLEIFPGSAVTQERVLSPAEKPGRDEFIETGRYDADSLAGG